jgi:hypothetical protein
MGVMRRLLIAQIAAVAAATAAGCGGSAGPDQGARQTTPAPARSAPGAPRPAGPLEVPSRVPRTGEGAADPASVTVIKGWANALLEGRIEKAAGFFALPSKVQNGTPVLTLSKPRETQAFNDALPCGATVTRTQRAGDFTLVTYKLTERPGGDCMGAAGALAFGAIRVRDGKIVEWYRLPGTGGESKPPSLPSNSREA